jgi:hypothetical protein
VPENDIITDERILSANSSRNKRRISFAFAKTEKSIDIDSRHSSQGPLDGTPIFHGNRLINLTMNKKDVLIKKNPQGTIIHKH